MVGSAVPFALSASVPNTPPLPIAAQLDEGSLTGWVDFDQPLQANPALPAPDWYIQDSIPRRWTLPTLSATGIRVSISASFTTGATGPPLIQYRNNANNLLGANGLPVADFDIAPTIIP